ncbi:bacterio-opsin activator domain-containing protein [Halocatena marina]|uniref:bacterio-opsin activator domain-containing protein n=1 Tax=Halocatena marina TaxID=2934937 RepID=UPI0022253064|nr:bacterio-opsin activator domain-containing protein [Halocatena marina]
MSSLSSALDSACVLLVGTTDWVGTLAQTLETDTGATVRVVATADEALTVYHEESVHCLISEYALAESTGLQLLRTIRAETTTTPVILCTAAGNESIASEAVSAGVTDYIALTGDEAWIEDSLERIERAIRTARRTETLRDRARQFDAIFHDSRSATWVLDPDGHLVRVNQTAREMIEHDTESVVEQPFWTLPWWPRSNGIQSDVRQIVEKALDGTFSTAVITRTEADDSPQVSELSARPVRDERGSIVSIIVEEVDITERVDLERELRQSEELHRVTLNNMTDTVLITDDSGAYTYVCPNVHFIFGYTANEIRELGTIDALLGDDLFDRDELTDNGVLKNIECTATDKAGREHTLLVNVREVSIQDGTLLYSCRDITKRKQREEALATLQETTRDFLYAETRAEIAQRTVEDVSSVLGLDASAVYLFDVDGNNLQPTAYSTSMERLNGPPLTTHTDPDSLTGYSFVEDESLFFDDVHSSDRLENRATDLRSAAYIPLGEHGVFIAGAADVGLFDDVTRELADLLAATAEAALDRVKRESRLREQDRELQHQNSQLTALNRINEIIRDIDQALVQAETREEIDRAVCDRLTADDRFAFAWIGVIDPVEGSLQPRAWAGAERGYLDSLAVSVDESESEPSKQTAATREVTMVTNVANRLRQESWRKEALSRGFHSVLSVLLAYDEFTYGVLTVYAESQNAFDETSRAVLAELGETIASATSAVERKNALVTTSMTRLEFKIEDPAFVLSRLAQEADCTLSYHGGVQQTTDGVYVFVTVEGAVVDAAERVATELVAVEEVHRISADGTEGVLRLKLAQPFLALELADHGAVLHSASVDASSANLVIDVPDSVDVRHITQLVTEPFDNVEFQSKQTLDRTSSQSLYSQFLDQLTDRQLEVVQMAYYSGFFESPRENTGEEIADVLDISPTAFYRHARTVQRKLFSTLFDDVGIPTSSMD